MEKITFLVRGSAPTPYEVTFALDGQNPSAFCTCPAGDNGMYCKHRFAILCGDSVMVAGTSVAEVRKVATWLKGTDAEKAIREPQFAEAAFEEAKQAVSAAKKRLAAAFRN
jgi:uncharacterized Zn finger protein